jgi:hypothetical protein
MLDELANSVIIRLRRSVNEEFWQSHNWGCQNPFAYGTAVKEWSARLS